MRVLEKCNFSRLINPVSGDISDTCRLFVNHSPVRFFKPFKGDKSDTGLLANRSSESLIKLSIGERSEMLFSLRFNQFRFIANSSPVKSLISLLFASSRSNVAISDAVIMSRGALLSAASIAARRFGSGMSTDSPGIRSGRCTTGGRMLSGVFSAEITSSKLDVHASRFTVPFSSVSVCSPKFFKLCFTRICARNASVSNPTAAAASEAPIFSNACWN